MFVYVYAILFLSVGKYLHRWKRKSKMKRILYQPIGDRLPRKNLSYTETLYPKPLNLNPGVSCKVSSIWRSLAIPRTPLDSKPEPYSYILLAVCLNPGGFMAA